MLHFLNVKFVIINVVIMDSILIGGMNYFYLFILGVGKEWFCVSPFNTQSFENWAEIGGTNVMTLGFLGR